MTGPREPPAIATGQLRRSVRLATLPVAAMGYAAEGRLRRWAGQDPDRVRRALRQRNAARTRRTLAELKGGALKAGQLLSTVEALFPQDPESTWRTALTDLQSDNPALPFHGIEPVLAAELGSQWRRDFGAFRETPVAAASLGQVYRAAGRDGRPLAVKVQYPGVREALASDVRTLSGVTRLVGRIAPQLALPPLVAELRARLTEELDYEHEGATQERFAEAYEGDPDVVIPRVLRATPRVLVMDWLAGRPLAAVATVGTGAQRDRAARLYQRFLVSGPERAGLLHTDPHPGNFRLMADGRLGVLDFGSSLALAGGLPTTFGRLIRVLLAGTDDDVRRGLAAEGFLRADAEVDIARLRDYMAPFTEPARHEEFAFRRAWLKAEFGRVNDPRNPDFAVALQLTLPAEHLFTHRVWLGMVGVLCQLEATVPVRPVLRRWLPGFLR